MRRYIFSLTPINLLLWLVASILVVQPVVADIYESSEHVLHFTQLDAERILSNSVINDIAQDEYGFIWVATQDGLNRFDGNYAEYYNNEPGNPTSLAFNWVWDIHVDSKGQIWAVGDGGISKYVQKTDSFINYVPSEQYPNLRGSKFRVIAEAPNGELWFGTQTAGIAVYTPKTDSFRQIQSVENTANTLSNNNIRDILIEPNGTVWVATLGGGLNMLASQQTGFVSFTTKTEIAIPSNKVRSLYIDDVGTLWIGTQDNGVFTFDKATGVIAHHFYQENVENSFCDN